MIFIFNHASVTMVTIQVISSSSKVLEGCPISALLFILVVELLAISIRNSKKIKGITIDQEIYKICHLVDYTTLLVFVDELKSVQVATSVFSLAAYAA